MAGDEEAEHLFFILQPRVFVPVRRGRQSFALLALGGRQVCIEDIAEESALPRRRIFLRLLRALDRLVQRCGNLPARPEGVHRPGLDQRLQHALVEQPQVHLVAELPQAAEALLPFRAQRLSCGVDRDNRVVADVLDRRQPKADGLARIRAHRREVGIRHLHAGRHHGDIHLAALGDVLHHVLRLRCLAGQKRGHELHRVVRLQPRRVIRQQRVGGGVGFVEAIPGELGHQVEDGPRDVLGMMVGRRACHEVRALLLHLLLVLLAHRAAQQVGLAQRVARNDIGDLHHLFLVDDDAQRLLQQRLQLRQHVLHRAPPPLAFDEVVDHPALDGPRPVESIQRRKVFHRGGPVAAQHVAHPARLKLEYARSERAMEDLLVRRRVVQRDRREIEVDALRQFDQLERVVNDGQRGQTEEVHLQQAHLFDRLHVVRGDNGIVLGARHRHKFGKRLGRNHHARGVNTRAAHQSLQPHRRVNQLADLGVFIRRGQLRRVFESVIDRDPNRRRN